MSPPKKRSLHLPEKGDTSLLLKRIVRFDENITRKIIIWTSKVPALQNLRAYYKTLEISCHGIPWFAFWIAFTWLFNTEAYIQMQVNMLLGLFLDIVLVASLKAYVCRQRPRSNKDDALGQIGPDHFSFPSGHASRAFMVTWFFSHLHPIAWPLQFLLLAWAGAVSASRLLMERHYLLDVLSGILLGVVEGMLLGWLWVGEEGSRWIMGWLGDEKIDGGEYHV